MSELWQELREAIWHAAYKRSTLELGCPGMESCLYNLCAPVTLDLFNSISYPSPCRIRIMVVHKDAVSLSSIMRWKWIIHLTYSSSLAAIVDSRVAAADFCDGVADWEVPSITIVHRATYDQPRKRSELKIQNVFSTKCVSFAPPSSWDIVNMSHCKLTLDFRPTKPYRAEPLPCWHGCFLTFMLYLNITISSEN